MPVSFSPDGSGSSSRAWSATGLPLPLREEAVSAACRSHRPRSASACRSATSSSGNASGVVERVERRSSGVSTPGPGRSALTCTAMRSPCHSTRNCSSDSICSSGLTANVSGSGAESRRGRRRGRRGAAPGWAGRRRHATRRWVRARNRERTAGLVGDELDDVGVRKLGRVGQCVGDGGHHAVGLRGQGRGAGVDHGGRDQRLVALHVDDHGVVGRPSCSTASARRSLPEGWSAARHQRLHAVARRRRRRLRGRRSRRRPGLAPDSARRAGRRARSSAGRRCRPAACSADASTPAAPG